MTTTTRIFSTYIRLALSLSQSYLLLFCVFPKKISHGDLNGV